jgi:glycerol transport system permease protein
MKNRAWLFLTPALVLVSLSAFIPLMTVVNYSLHVLFPGSIPYYVGLQNFREVLNDEVFMGCIKRQIIFALQILIVQIPMGLAIALAMPKKGNWLTLMIVLLGIPLLIPYNVTGMVWRVFTRMDLGVVPRVFASLGYDYRPVEHVADAWWTTVVMDVWHWVPLVTLLCFAGLQTIPDAFYQAAKIDGASTWATFRKVTLPKLRYVLTIAVLLRTMDSFNIYSEPYILTGGGPGTSTLFMSIYVSSQAAGAFDMGTGAALSVVYLVIVVVLCYLLYTMMLNVGKGGAGR